MLLLLESVVLLLFEVVGFGVRGQCMNFQII